MTNRWTITRESLACWVARVPALTPADARRWRTAAVRRAEDLGVYRIEASPTLDYRRAEHGDLTAFLDRDLDRGRAEPGPGVFAPGHVAVTRLAVFAPGPVPVVVERETADAAAVHGSALLRHRPPVSISAVRGSPDGFDVFVTIHADVWLPWVSILHEEEAEAGDFADNTELASRNGTRLNAYLDALRAETVRCGGTFGLDAAETDPLWRFEVDDTGVQLDAGRPH